jgi:hypothetical protein
MRVMLQGQFRQSSEHIHPTSAQVFILGEDRFTLLAHEQVVDAITHVTIVVLEDYITMAAMVEEVDCLLLYLPFDKSLHGHFLVASGFLQQLVNRALDVVEFDPVQLVVMWPGRATEVLCHRQQGGALQGTIFIDFAYKILTAGLDGPQTCL